ncbi:MAG TPA: alpha/beta hydrolase [Caulobacteraceae bacterium]
MAGWLDKRAAKKRSRPKGVIAKGANAFLLALTGKREHVPTGEEYPEQVVKRVSFEAGGGYGWKLSALWSPRETPAPWKIVVVTGAPSWAEYWAPVIAALPPDREMLVVDRPGFAHSEPFECVPDLHTQAEALLPALRSVPGQKVLLVGQSYGAAIATLMAHMRPKDIAGLVLLSGYFGHAGPTARFWVDMGKRVLGFIPRDLKNAVTEVAGQAGQLNRVFRLLTQHPLLVTFIHGDEDDFAPIEVARRVAELTMIPSRFIEVTGADHFFNDEDVGTILACLEAAIDPRGQLREVRAMAEASSTPIALAV